jgi:hypothetical protein
MFDALKQAFMAQESTSSTSPFVTNVQHKIVITLGT